MLITRFGLQGAAADSQQGRRAGGGGGGEREKKKKHDQRPRLIRSSANKQRDRCVYVRSTASASTPHSPATRGDAEEEVNTPFNAQPAQSSSGWLFFFLSLPTMSAHRVSFCPLCRSAVRESHTRYRLCAPAADGCPGESN